jgi:rRNA maturation protein Rpf1
MFLESHLQAAGVDVDDSTMLAATMVQFDVKPVDTDEERLQHAEMADRLFTYLLTKFPRDRKAVAKTREMKALAPRFRMDAEHRAVAAKRGYQKRVN